MTTIADIEHMAETRWRVGRHWERVAYARMRERRFEIILNRNDANVYMVRFWLNEPVVDAEDGSFKFNDSTLLHYFCRGDDDQSLHDHPAGFETEILVGGYDEHLPPFHWKPGSELGPAWDEVIVTRFPGDRLVNRADHLHCVGRVCPGTMTLVTTGPRERDWGFHPPGRPWVKWREFIHGRESLTAAAS